MKKLFLTTILCLISCVLCLKISAQEDSEVTKYVSIRKIEGAKLVCIDTLSVKINTRKGETACSFAIPYSKMDKIVIENAYIADIFGKVVRKLKNSEITTQSYIGNSAFYQDTYLKRFELKHNIYPYTINVCYKITYNDFFAIDNWRAISDIWEYNNIVNQSVKSAKLVVDIPNNYEIKYSCKNIDEPKIENKLDRKFLTWQTAYQKQKWENYAPYSALKIPQVMIAPLNFKYGAKGSWQSWESFAEWVNLLNKNTRSLPIAEKQNIDKLLLNTTDTRQKIEILYKYLQKNTRYVNVSLNIGGLKSHTAEYVSLNKYGDCKALSTYMLAMLNYAGIPAHYTLIYSDDNIRDIDFDFPFQVFNHVIVCVPLANDTLFLDCTEKNIPFGYVGAFIQNRPALVCSDKPFFAQTSKLTEKDVECLMNAEVNSNSISVKLTQRGDDYSLFSFIENNLSKTTMEKYMQRIFSGAFQLENYKVQKSDLPEIFIDLQLKNNNLQKIYGNDIFINPFARDIFSDLEKPAERKQEFRLDFPLSYSDTIIYNLPQNLDIKEFSRTEQENSKFGKYFYNFVVANNQLIVIKQRTIYSGKYDLEQYADFYAFIEKLNKIEQQDVHLEVKN